MTSEVWFHGNIDRRAAERMLKSDGDFLVREKSDGTGACVVSVMCRGVHKHFLLNKTDDVRKIFYSRNLDLDFYFFVYFRCLTFEAGASLKIADTQSTDRLID